MSDLTQQEIDDAPDWATHYIKTGNCVLFESEDKTQQMMNGKLGGLLLFGPVSEDAKPITRKEFDGCVCQGCKAMYKVDVVIPDDLWEKIKPKGAIGSGLLCGACMFKKIDLLGEFSAFHLSPIE